jgi:hypothetical protein
VHHSASSASTSNRNSNGFTVTNPTSVASNVQFYLQARSGDSCSPPPVFREAFLRRADLLKPDVMSEVILLAAGALVCAILVLILVVVLTKGSAP